MVFRWLIYHKSDLCIVFPMISPFSMAILGDIYHKSKLLELREDGNLSQNAFAWPSSHRLLMIWGYPWLVGNPIWYNTWTYLYDRFLFIKKTNQHFGVPFRSGQPDNPPNPRTRALEFAIKNHHGNHRQMLEVMGHDMFHSYGKLPDSKS